jgi:hypothetical protein
MLGEFAPQAGVRDRSAGPARGIPPDHTTAHRIEARTNDANTGEQKAFEGKYVGVLVYGLLREDRRPQT